jgi:hypothetical protein
MIVKLVVLSNAVSFFGKDLGTVPHTSGPRTMWTNAVNSEG